MRAETEPPFVRSRSSPEAAPMVRARARTPAGLGTRSSRQRSSRPRRRPRRARQQSAIDASRNPPEPDGRESSTDQQQRGRAAREEIGDLTRLLLAAESRAKSLVDLTQVRLARRREEVP